MEDACKLGVKDFSANILGQTIHFHVISLQQSFFLWAGTKLSFKSLAVAMQTKFVSHDCGGQHVFSQPSFGVDKASFNTLAAHFVLLAPPL